MNEENLKEVAAFIYDDLRLTTFPAEAKFLKDTSDFPEKTRQDDEMVFVLPGAGWRSPDPSNGNAMSSAARSYII